MEHLLGAAVLWWGASTILADFGGDNAVYWLTANFWSPWGGHVAAAEQFAHGTIYPPLYPLVLAVTGEHMRRSTLLYMGWFGPRGLATIILTIEIVDTSDLVHGPTIANAALLTVGLSVLAHGLTAWWGSNVYADSIEAHPDGDEVRETNPTNLDVRVPLRSRHPHPPNG